MNVWWVDQRFDSRWRWVVVTGPHSIGCGFAYCLQDAYAAIYVRLFA